MEERRWVEAVTHILTNPTTKPSLHSQFFIGALVPCYLSWDYPPVFCGEHLRQWWFSQFLRLGHPRTSWRSNCPYYQPPSPVLAAGMEEGKWGREDRREFARKRLSRKKLVSQVNPLIPLLLPNMLLFTLLLWDPLPD